MDYCIFCMNKNEDPICRYCGRNRHEYVSAVHHLKPGSLLNGRYLIGSVLGEGGFGITYIGRDTNLDMRVAIKEYFPSGVVNRNNTSSTEITALVGDPERSFKKGKAGFLSEARTLARFSNEQSIVSVRDFFEENNTAYIVMEYLEGTNLKDYIAENGAISFSQAVCMLSPIMTSLSKIHAQGLIHRDISPANIMILKDGTVKLLDFGAARNVSGADEKSLSVLLKPGFAPEEQYRSKGNQGPWTDVYALSATLYKMVTAITPDDAMNRLFSDDVQPPSAINPYVTAKQSDIIMKGMSVYQKDRYQSIEELQAACAACENDIPHMAGIPAAVNASGFAEKTYSGEALYESAAEKTVYEIPVSGEERNIPRKTAPHIIADAKADAHKESTDKAPKVSAGQKAKRPKIWGLIGSVVAGFIVLLNIVLAIFISGDPTMQASDFALYAVGIVIFSVMAVGFGYFYYPLTDNKNRKPNKPAFIASIVLTVCALIMAFIGFTAFGSDLAGTGTGESGIGLAVLFAVPALYLGYFYYPRLEKKKRGKYIRIYGGTAAAIAAAIVIYTVFITLSTVSIGDEKIKKNAESVEITTDLLTDADIEKISQLKNLKSLSLNACLLDDGDVKIIGNMKQLEKLSLVGNVDIRDITPIGGLTNLTFLNLELTGVEDISPLSKLTKLTHLSISESKVKDVSVIKELSALEVFYMNNLQNLDPATINVPMGLIEFHCNNNELTNIDFLKGNIALNRVELSGNKLTDISPLSAKPLSMVNIENNQITDISPIAVVNSELKAKGNRINDISCLKGTKAESIDLSDNNISDISAFADNATIRSLELQNNEITDISALGDCFNIYKLNLSGNMITDISALATVDSLDILDLSSNSIVDISPLSQNANYVGTDSAIYLNDNQIKDISPLSGFKSCRMIWLDNNKIKDVSPLTGCTALENLFIKNNDITDISALAGLASLRVIQAVGNPIENIGDISLVSGGNIIEQSILSVSYTDAIDWKQVKSLKIDDIRVYDIPARLRGEMDDLGYRTNYDSSAKEEDNG